MEQQPKNKKIMLQIIGVAILVIGLVGITYAFFNYTRTGTANTIRVGRIAFNTTQASGQNGAIDLSNAFPISRTEAATDTDNSGEVVITITGDTDYSGGVEYLVTATGVTNIVGGKSVPIGVIVTPSAGLGTADSSYYTNRSSATSHIYKVEVGNNINNNDRILVGYIAPNTTSGTASGVNGTLTIKAFIDSSLIAISDTYYENAPTPTPTSTPLAGPNDEYGTTTEWVDDRVVLTTTEWNSLQSSGISFKVKVEANEGIWVVPTIPSCPGCKFIYTENEYFYSANNYNSSPISTLTTFENNNETLVDDYRTLNKNYFLGFKFDGNGVITNAYACGIKGTDYLNDEEQTPGVNAGTAFCVEGSVDGSTYSANNTFLNDSTTGIWQGRCDDDGSSVDCYGSVGAYADSTGYVGVGDGVGSCYVDSDGNAYFN